MRRVCRLALPLLAQLAAAGCAGGQSATNPAPASFVRADTVALRRRLDSLASAHRARTDGDAVASDALRPEVTRLFSTADAAEGVRSFVERRPARFQGR